ncbi:MAG: c-type cytochrome [Planctomycetota bacterium]|nr:c-type cytochrome [Planctomycetota bacterium]
MRRLHIAFGIACFLLLAGTVYVLIQDHYGREFRKYQEAYEAAELQRLGRERSAVEEQLSAADFQAERAALEARAAAAEQELAANKAVLAAAQENVKSAAGRLSLAERELNVLKAEQDTLRYEVDAGKRPLQDWTAQQKKADAKFAEAEALRADRDAALKAVAALQAGRTQAEAALRQLLSARDDIALKIRRTAGSPALNLLRDAPGLDMFSPRRRIEQVVLKNLPVDLHFEKTQRVDRCMTCHQAIDNPDPKYRTATVPQASSVEAGKKPAALHPVLRSHPRLDLFVGANSKHPAARFGCTICHQGRPLGVAFSRAAHTPRDQDQAEEWRRNYQWEPLEFWDQPMLPLQYTEASCLKCHRGLDEIPGAPRLNEGRDLFRSRGCTNCHMGASGDKDLAWVGRVGPDLRRIGEKDIQPWVQRWIANPWEFRPSTRMPRLFGLENRRDAGGEPLTIALRDSSVPRDAVEIEAIATYLFATSKLRETPPPPGPSGSAENGRKLFAATGCAGCHPTREKPGDEQLVFSAHAPDLSRIGSKVSAGWLFSWLRNPRQYWPETKMPDMRLSAAEAADIAAYLLQAMQGKESALPSGTYPEEAFDALIIDKLSPTMSRARIAALLKDTTALLEYSTNGTFVVPRASPPVAATAMGLSSLRAKVKYVTGPDGKRRDSGDGEWTEAQIAKITDVLSAEPDKARAVKAFYAGEFLIQHYGCYGCHNIQGWTHAPLPCPNLQREADKDLARFAFGHALTDNSIARTRWDWLRTKVSRPRVYDVGSLDLLKPLERLSMPWFGYVKPAAEPQGQPTAAAARGTQPGKYHPASNPDVSSPFGLTPALVDCLVTHLLSLTLEPIPAAMQRTPLPQELAADRGHRVFRELNCAGCHLVGLSKGPPAGISDTPGQLPAESLLALLTPQANKGTDDGIYADADLVAVDYAAPQPTPPVPPALAGLLNIKRGTCLTSMTVPILLCETTARPNSEQPPVPIGFRLIKGEKKPADGAWLPLGELLSLDRFRQLTVPTFYRDAAVAAKAYDSIRTWWAEQGACERLAGTAALRAAGKLTARQVEERTLAGRFFEPTFVAVRFTRGEGPIIPHIIKLEQERGVTIPRLQPGGAGPQQAPPSLVFEGARVHPDWLYQYLRNVYTLRLGYTIRMPSFWGDAALSASKTVYPTGRLAAHLGDLPDDAAEVVEFLMADACEKPFGYQPLPLNGAGDRTLYEQGRQLVTADSKSGGLGCMDCHMFGQRTPPEPKWALNLANVKRRLKGPWLNRWLINPQSIYPWTNMPNNFKLDWLGSYNFALTDPLRGIMGDDEAKLQDSANRIRAVEYYLLHLGEGEIGETPAQARP